MVECVTLQVDDYTDGHEILYFMEPQIFIIVFKKACNQPPAEAVVLSAYPYTCLHKIQLIIP